MDEENMEHDTLQDIFDGITQPTDIKFSALERITGNFSKKQIIGEGGFGTVYKVNFSFHRKNSLNKLNISCGLSELFIYADKRVK
jgi:hypothetical protein